MKRFYRSAAAGPCEAGFHILLDGRPVKTPAKKNLTIPSAALAKAIAAEWRAQGEDVLPEVMPLTRLASTAIDRVLGRESEIALEIAAFGGSELVCYRAEAPDDLVKRQCAAWDPYLDWLKQHSGAALKTTKAVQHVAQPDVFRKLLTKAIESHDVFEMMALHSAVSLSGSLVIGLALAAGHVDADQAFRDSHLDEIYQAERWGAEWQAERRRGWIREGLVEAETFLRLHRRA